MCRLSNENKNGHGKSAECNIIAISNQKGGVGYEK